MIHQLRWLWNHPASEGVYTVLRAAAWAVRSALHRPAVVPYGSGLRFYCPPEARGIARVTYIFRDRYEPELAALGRFVRRGDRVVDVGAHYGTYTLKLAQLVGSEGEVIAVEPAQHAIAVLNRNLALNSLRNVRVERYAAGDKTHVGMLHVDRNPSRNALVATRDQTGETERVSIKPLDDLIADRVSFIKIDVEGAELLVLRGAARVLAAYRPVVQFEYTPAVAREMGLEPGEAWERLEVLGYQMHELIDGQLRRIDSAPEKGLLNIIAISPRAG